ncbi:hypothetical protein ACFX12_026974 [Malus domestica]
MAYCILKREKGKVPRIDELLHHITNVPQTRSLHTTGYEKALTIKQLTVTTSDYSNRSRKLSVLSSLAVPELDDSPIASGEAALWDASFFREVGIPEIS